MTGVAAELSVFTAFGCVAATGRGQEGRSVDVGH